LHCNRSDAVQAICETLGIELSNKATKGLRSASTGDYLRPPRFGSIYGNHDETQIRAECYDLPTAKWIDQVVADKLSLHAVPVASLGEKFVWYSAWVEHTELLHIPSAKLRDILAYVNGLMPSHLMVGEGSVYGRRALPRGGAVLYVGLDQKGQLRLKECQYIFQIGAVGRALLYPCELGEDGPDDTPDPTSSSSESSRSSSPVSVKQARKPPQRTPKSAKKAAGPAEKAGGGDDDDDSADEVQLSNKAGGSALAIAGLGEHEMSSKDVSASESERGTPSTSKMSTDPAEPRVEEDTDDSDHHKTLDDERQKRSAKEKEKGGDKDKEKLCAAKTRRKK